MVEPGGNANVAKEVRELLAEILETEPDKIKGDANFVKDLGMDSMMALEMLAAIEKKYRIVIHEESLARFTSLNQTVELVKELLTKKK